MSWRSIKIKEEEKQLLDDIKQKITKERGREPSYSETINMLADNSQIGRKEKEKRKNKRDFMELF